MSGPIARPIASSQSPESPRTWATSVATSAATLSPLSRPQRVSAARLDRIASDLQPDDLAVLAFLAEVRLATGAQVARRLWAADGPTDPRARQARRSLRRLETSRAIDRLPRRLGGVRAGSASIIYGLGPVGVRLLQRGGFTPRGAAASLGLAYVAHQLDVTELAVGLHQADRDGELELIEIQSEPACWRGFLSGFGGRLVLKPDLFVRVGVGALEDRWWVEVDRATESLTAIRRKLERYLAYIDSGEEQARHGVVPRIIITTPNDRRRDQILSVVERMNGLPERLVVVWPYAETLARVAMEARS